jgi:hypothetical protein
VGLSGVSNSFFSPDVSTLGVAEHAGVTAAIDLKMTEVDLESNDLIVFLKTFFGILIFGILE